MVIAGVDEVGRGTLAGPVVACACVMPEGYTNPLIKDSKKLSFKKRAEVNNIILCDCLSFGLGVVCNYIIDEINILEATKQAMQIAISNLKTGYDKIIIDAVKLNNLNKPFLAENKADDKYIEVSAASIIAKVYRDNLMMNMSTYYPDYKWEQNFGYGTKAHIDAIKNIGISPLHRKSFLKSYI